MTNCDLSMINGNSIDIKPHGCDSEIKADIVVSEFNSVRLWGQVVNCYGQPVSNALLKLVKVVEMNGKCVYQGIAHSVSDCAGFYQFDLCADDPCAKYKVLVNKSAVGTERIIETSDGCNACSENSYSPCNEYKYRVTPPDKFDCDTSCGCNKIEYKEKCPCEHCNSNACPPTHSGLYAKTKIRF